MSLVPDTSEPTTQGGASSQKRTFISSLLHLPRNVYLLLLFTTGKGFHLRLYPGLCLNGLLGHKSPTPGREHNGETACWCAGNEYFSLTWHWCSWQSLRRCHS